MSRYKHLSTKEREYLLIQIKTGKKNKEIAQGLGRSPSTISREIRRNSTKRGEYSAVDADSNYKRRRKNSVRRYKLDDKKTTDKVSRLLNLMWSPEEISNRLKSESSSVCISTCTIYRGLESGRLDPALRKKLRIKGKIRFGGHKKSNCGHLDIEYLIHDRPKSVENRKVVGHWESDTVRGAKWSGCIATHIECKSRYAILCKIPDRTAGEFNSATLLAFRQLPECKRRSLTADHGKEFANHREIYAKLHCKVYFADPHTPWQRGTNENFNGLLRQFFPKRTSFSKITQQDVDVVAGFLNRRPRKCLG